MKKLLITFFATCLPLALYAYDFIYDGIMYSIVSESDQTVEVASREESLGMVVSNPYRGRVFIPSSVYNDGKQYTVVGIGKRAFINCINVSSVSLPLTIRYIKDEAFALCTQMNSITIPFFVTDIGVKIFYLSSISEIVSTNQYPPVASEESFVFGVSNNHVLFVPEGSVFDYQNANGWNRIGNILEINNNNYSINGHDYVDFGLPSGRLWAVTNFGANSQEEYGEYINWENKKIVSDTWGNDWTIPSRHDINELLEYCNFTLTYQNGVLGYQIGRHGSFIFLPAAGLIRDGNYSDQGECLYYWTKDKGKENGYAYFLYGDKVGLDNNSTSNYSIDLMPIRPVVFNATYDEDDEEEPIVSHDYVDLGLPSGNLWAKTNVGAENEFDYGYFYAFGETRSKDYYHLENYKWYDQVLNQYTKYSSEYSFALPWLLNEDDVATKKWGDMWHTPSHSDYHELLEQCTSKWEEKNGTWGRSFIGANGNTIFFPASGYTYSYNQYVNELGYYLTSNTEVNQDCILFRFSATEISDYWLNVKYQGYSVRPVIRPWETSIDGKYDKKKGTDQIYNIQGVRKTVLSKGLNIIKMKNGQIRKIIKK